MNTDVMYSSKTDMWETPQDFFDKLNEEFHFTLDVCAVPENAKCERYFTQEQDGLSQKWEGVVWCNPPYGRYITGKWVKKAYEESQRNGCTVVMLLPSRTSNSWFHDYILDKTEIRFIRGRLKFGGSKNSAPFPSIVAIFRGNSIDFGIKKRGMWKIKGKNCNHYEFECTVCGASVFFDNSTIFCDYEYCPYCGTKMDMDEEE